MSIDANRVVRDWCQSNFPGITVSEDAIKSLLADLKAKGSRKNANWVPVYSLWAESLQQKGKINSTEAKEMAKSIQGESFNEKSYGPVFPRWCNKKGLRQVEKIGNLRVYAEDFLPNTPMGKIKGLVQAKKPVDLASILKNHGSSVQEAQELLRDNGYKKDHDKKWRYKG